MIQLHRRGARESGAALIEFAIVSLALYLILAAILTFGSAIWIGQNLQQAVDVGAQELARLPLDPDIDLGWGDLQQGCAAPEDVEDFAACDGRVLDEIYDKQYLVITRQDISNSNIDPDSPTALLEYAETLPLINRLLIPVMIFDRQHSGGSWRYPGAVVLNTVTPEPEETVLVPIVRNGEIRWVAPVEEVRVDHDGDSATAPVGPFSVLPPEPTPPGFVPGVVALRINYPFQSAAMSDFTPSPEGALEPNLDRVVTADDASLTAGATGVYALQVAANSYADGEPNIHGGRYGLGRQIALPFDRDSIRTFGVRPYRRILSVQAIYRREVFDFGLGSTP